MTAHDYLNAIVAVGGLTAWVGVITLMAIVSDKLEGK